METLKLLEKKEVLLAKSTYFVRPKRLKLCKNWGIVGFVQTGTKGITGMDSESECSGFSC